MSIWHDLLWTIISAILGGFFGLLLVIITDWFKRPVLVYKKGGESFGSATHPLGNFKIIHIKVMNKNRKFSCIPIGILTAFSTQAQVTLKDKSGAKQFSGKWTNNPEPIMSGQVQPSIALIPPKIDIYPSSGNDDEFQEVAIGIKYDGEDEFYSFDNTSYMFNKHKNPNLQFGTGNYNGSVVFSTLGIKYHMNFKLYNKSSNLDEFYLKVE